tara:strand:- start:594 stop:1463 length:870 start_codon:yes stop_codon:yes gene_type:complete
MSPSSNAITENFDKIYAEGFEEGHTEGYEEGYAEAKNDMIREIAELEIENATKILRQLDIRKNMENEIKELQKEYDEIEDVRRKKVIQNVQLKKDFEKLNDKISKITSILTKPSKIGYVKKIKNVLEIIGDDEKSKKKPTYEELGNEIEELKKVSNVKTDLINELFSKIVKKADIDDGISITREYGHKYLDEWNKIYEDLIKDTIKVMNECELADDGVYLEFHNFNNIEFCMEIDRDDECEEDGCYGECMKCDCKLYNGEGEYCNDGSCDLCGDCYVKHYAECKSCKCE